MKPDKIYQLTIPMTPVAKGRPRMGKYGAYTPAKTRKAEEAYRVYVKPYAPSEPHTGAIRIDMTFYLPIPKSVSKKKRQEMIGRPHIKRPDGDNFEKLLLDAIDGLFFKDDSQVYHVFRTKLYDENPRIDINIFIED